MPEKKDFVIKDRRMFSEEAQDVEEKEDQEKPSSEELKKPAAEEATEEAAGPEEAQEDFPLPEINFSTFIFSLNTSVLVHLGVIEDPATGKTIFVNAAFFTRQVGTTAPPHRPDISGADFRSEIYEFLCGNEQMVSKSKEITTHATGTALAA